MSVDITIKEQGVARNIDDATKIVVDQYGGGSATYVPISDVALAPISITENGTYTAEDAHVYGLNPATVAVEKKYVTGKGRDGNTHRYSVDDNGYLRDEVLPSYILVTVLPDRTTYNNGEAIDYTGIQVKAYYADGSVYDTDRTPGGVVPFNELILPVTVAEFDLSKTYYSDGNGINALRVIYTYHYSEWIDPFTGQLQIEDIWCGDTILGQYEGHDATLCYQPNIEPHEAVILLTMYQDQPYAYRVSGNSGLNLAIYVPGEPSATRRVGWSIIGGSTYRSNAEHFEAADIWGLIDLIPNSTSDPRYAGEMEQLPPMLTIPVQWNRPGDGETLATDFEISMIAPTSAGDGQ